MKIGSCFSLFSNDYARWGEKRYIKLKEYGYSCVDFNLANTDSTFYTLPQNESDEMLLSEKQMIFAAGLEISQTHGPWRWPPKDLSEEDRSERMEKMKRSIRMTSLLGCNNIVIHPVMPYGIEDKGTENEAKTWDINLAFMQELLKTAKEYNITICLENMPMRNFSLGTPEEILNFVKTINDDNFKICLDTGHVAIYENLSLGEEVRRLGNELRVLHVHDNVVGIDWHLFPKFGRNDWEDFVKALKEIEYEGVFSLEVAPPESFSDELFDYMAIGLMKIVKEILK